MNKISIMCAQFVLIEQAAT